MVYMKMRLVLIIGTLFCSSVLFAQEPADALRYSWLTPSGTARSQATGGAMVSLGGEFTSTFVNPAGLGMYKTNEIVLTPGYQFQNIKGNYLGTTEKDSKSGFNYGATGLVFATSSNQGSAWRNFSFSFGLNRLANFNSNVVYTGLNNQSSYSEKYLEQLIRDNVTDPNVAATNYPYGASLALNTYLIDTIQGAGGVVSGYKTLATPQTGVNQKQGLQTKGGITEFAIGGAGNLRDKFYVGATLGIDVLSYEKTSNYNEADATTNTANNFNYFNVLESLETKGVGINVKLGVIYKPIERLRLGLAFHSPTVFALTDHYTTTLETDLEGYGGLPQVKHQSSIDFNSGLAGQNEYQFTNPLRVMFGASYVLHEVQDVTQQKGFITVDVEYVDYRASKFQSVDANGYIASDNYFENLNKVIDEIYKGAFNFRVGGELKFNTIMARLGFAWFGNPYEDPSFDANKMNLSGGLGYRHHGIFVDLTYVHQIGKDGQYPYLLEQGFFSPVALKGTTGNIVATFGFKF
jgi:hypothetical protein